MSAMVQIEKKTNLGDASIPQQSSNELPIPGVPRNVIIRLELIHIHIHIYIERHLHNPIKTYLYLVLNIVLKTYKQNELT